MSQLYFERIIREATERLETTPLQPVVDVQSLTAEGLAALIDHTLLKPEATLEQILKLCEEATEHRFASVCVNPAWAPVCLDQLANTGVAVCSVVGFPLGASTMENKVIEAEELVSMGVKEIDMVMNIGKLKDKQYVYVFEEIQQVADICRRGTVKVILETCLLTDEEIIAACVLAKEAGAKFVKTSTGFNKSGATKEAVALMRRVVGREMGVKAAGGIRDTAAALEMLRSGADRIGSSVGPTLVAGLATLQN
ncbi:MAG: deoxyribose-phosphate aldolase [candidate division KSB1 bacterium]|nr:deoxyribose-phosphate aldolase [candidate division KSB1 bacterium]